MEDTVFK